MKFSFFLNLIRKGIGNLLRNWMATIPTLLVMGIVVTLFHTLLIVREQANVTLDKIQQKFSFTVYLKDDADPMEVGNLITSLEERGDVMKPVVYTSKEEAWKLISNTFSLDTDLLKIYNFSLPASLTITPKDVESTSDLEALIKTNSHLIKTTLLSDEKQKNVADQMLQFIHGMQNGLFRTLILLIGIFVIGGILLFWSAIHLGITARHKEITIMKLVGASNETIVAPFVVEGLILSVSAFLIHLLLIIFLPFEGLDYKSNMNALILEFIAMVLLGGTVSYITAKFYIRRKILL